jgi:hypothetical protein
MAAPATTATRTGNGSSPPAPATPKLTLARVSKGKQPHAFWIHVHGPEGVGKSSLGVAAPDPIFIDAEQGTMNLETTRFQFDDTGRTMPRTFEEFLEAVRVIERESHPYKTLVVDTLDAVEALIWQHICARDGKENIAAYGYGKGENIVALDEWRKLVAALERVRAKGVNVLTLSHSIVKRFDDPESDGWDRYILKLHEKAGGLVKERADAVLFAKFETMKVKSKDDARKKRVALTDARFLYTRKTGAWDAKNRYDLPEEIPLDWGELETAIRAGKPASPTDLLAAISRKVAKLPEDLRTKTLAPGGFLEKAGNDAAMLSKLNTWLNAKLAEAGIEEE